MNLLLTALAASVLAPANGVVVESKTVAISGKRIACQIVRAPLSAVRIKVGFGQGKMSRTESLPGIAKRYGAIAAINGCFFDAYISSPIKNPHHTLISNGKMLHRGMVGTTFGVNQDGETQMEAVQWTIEGARDGNYAYPGRWYATWINRHPGTGTGSVGIFTPEWGPETGLTGFHVQVTDGKVSYIGGGSTKIPRNGFVIRFGDDLKLGQSFRPGQSVEYRVPAKAGSFIRGWEKVQEAMAAGPRLVKDGKVSVNPEAEGFSHEKILSLGGKRSALGITAQKEILFVVANGTIRELADVMKALGCQDAMNLDGGASSALWANGKSISPGGRDIANALLLLPKN